MIRTNLFKYIKPVSHICSKQGRNLIVIENKSDLC